MACIRVLIVEDHQLAREGLKAVLIRTGFEVVGETATGEEAIALVQEQVPDIVLMDVRLAGTIDGLEATRRISALGLPTRVLMLTLHDMPAYVREALAAGAAGYMLKDTAIDDLSRAIVKVCAGEAAVPLELMSAALRIPDRSERDNADVSSLTARERQVVDLIAEGMTNKEIGRHLSISPATVKAHVERLIVKLGVTDRTQAAVVAARQLALSREV